jgi:histidine decarboxylase
MYTATPVTNQLSGYAIEEPVKGKAAQEHREKLDHILKMYRNRLEDRTDLHLGYPYNLNFEVEALRDLQKYSINNLGDPWVER